VRGIVEEEAATSQHEDTPPSWDLCIGSPVFSTRARALGTISALHRRASLSAASRVHGPLMYLCPKCRMELRRAAAPDVGYWTCAECWGRAINLTQLRGKVEHDPINRLWRAAVEAQASRGRPCPGCEQPMVAVPVPVPDIRFAIDVCTKCEFFWFDADEFQAFPAVPPPPPPPGPKSADPLPAALSEILVRSTAKEVGKRVREREASDERFEWLIASLSNL
jgi:Zn-finger nucleic acid-binding protein